MNKSYRVVCGVLAVVGLLWASPVVAQSEESGSEESGSEESGSEESGSEESSRIERREAEMFGESGSGESGSEESGSEESGSEEEREEAMFGGDEESGSEASGGEASDEPSLEEKFEEELAEESDPLQLGGTYFGRLDYTILEEGDAAEDFPVRQPNIADIYLDSRPTDRLRFFTQGRLFFDPTVTEGETGQFGQTRQQLSVDLDQLWLKFDIARSVYVTIGRQQTRWGVGRFWFPNDFLFAQKRDPLAIFDERTGVDLIKFHIPVEKLGWNFYAVAQVDGADSWEEFGGAIRGEFLVGQTEFAVSSSYRTDQPLMIGADVSTGVWLFDLRGAATAMYGVEEPFFEGELDLKSLSNPNPMDWVVPREVMRDDEWFFRALGGAEIGIRVFTDDNLFIGAEYFYNGLGYDDAEIYPWLIFNNAFRPFYAGRHYGALYAALPGPGEWDDHSFTASTIANLSDQSFLSRLDYNLTMLTRLQFYAYASLFYGQTGEFNLSFDIPPVDLPGAPEQLEDGLSVPATRAQVGLGFQLDF